VSMSKRGEFKLSSPSYRQEQPVKQAETATLGFLKLGTNKHPTATCSTQGSQDDS